MRAVTIDLDSKPAWFRRQVEAAHGQPAQAKPAAEPRPASRKLNQTEREYLAMLLAAGHTVCPHEEITFRVGVKRCAYRPDFVTRSPDGWPEVHEVKGPFVREDSRVKFQSAALRYPAFRWVWARKLSDGWHVEEVKA